MKMVFTHDDPKEVSFKDFMKVCFSRNAYDGYIRITQLPNEHIGLLTHRKKVVKEANDSIEWSEFTIVSGTIRLCYKKDMTIPEPYVIHLHDFDSANLILLLEHFDPTRDKLFMEYYPKNNSQNNERCGLNQDTLHIRKMRKKIVHDSDTKYERAVSIDHQWKDDTTMLINMHDLYWKSVVEKIYMKSDVFKEQ